MLELQANAIISIPKLLFLWLNLDLKILKTILLWIRESSPTLFLVFIAMFLVIISLIAGIVIMGRGGIINSKYRKRSPMYWQII